MMQNYNRAGVCTIATIGHFQGHLFIIIGDFLKNMTTLSWFFKDSCYFCDG